ncbi:MAG: hypothetical protein MPW13_18470 [Candidatus Manganitrophus sp.]|nr:hypothetical protein [Candidatus Manganitrophus sp.]
MGRRDAENHLVEESGYGEARLLNRVVGNREAFRLPLRRVEHLHQPHPQCVGGAVVARGFQMGPQNEKVGEEIDQPLPFHCIRACH